MKQMPVLLAVMLTVVWTAQNPLQAQDKASSGDVRDVRVVRTVEQEPRAALLGEPHIAQWKPKHYIVAYEVGIPGKGDMGSIDAVVSTNDGQSWSIPSTIFSHTERHGTMQFAYANPVLYRPPGLDVVWCFAMRCPLHYSDSEDSHLAAAYSGDGGRSWNPVELAMNYNGPMVILGDIQRILEDGRPIYVLPAHCNTRQHDPHGTREHFVLRSTSLLEWSLGGYVPQPEPARIFLHEGMLAVTGESGGLKMVMRTSKMDKPGEALEPPRAWSTTSADGGRHWSAAQEEPALWNTVAKAWFGQSRTGAQLYVYNDGPAWSRMALWYKVKPADGEWSAERPFFDAGIHNSYPTLLETAPGEFCAVWDSGDAKRQRSAIRFGKFTLKP